MEDNYTRELKAIAYQLKILSLNTIIEANRLEGEAKFIVSLIGKEMQELAGRGEALLKRIQSSED